MMYETRNDAGQVQLNVIGKLVLHKLTIINFRPDFITDSSRAVM